MGAKLYTFVFLIVGIVLMVNAPSDIQMIGGLNLVALSLLPWVMGTNGNQSQPKKQHRSWRLTR